MFVYCPQPMKLHPAPFAALISVLLAGCQSGGIGMPGSPAWHVTTSPTQQAAYFGERCETYGFRPGTTEMAYCIQNEAGSSRNRASNRASQAFRTMGSQPVTTHCNRVGTMTNCTSF